jgi:hypothetical protein
VKIPRMSEDRVQEQSLPNVGFNVRGADFGQENIQQYEKGVQGILGEAEKIALKAQKEADESVQLEAGSRLAQFELTQNQRIRETRGKNALGLDKAYQDDYSKMQNEMAAMAKNPRQKAMIGRLMLSTDSQLRNNISAHTSKEMEAVYENQSAAMVEMDRTAAVDSMNPKRVAESIGKQKAIVEQLGAKKGWSKEELALNQTEVEKSTYVSYIQRMADTDADMARKMVEEHKEVLGEEGPKMNGYIARQERQRKYVAKNTQIDNDIKFMEGWSGGKVTDVNTLLKSDKAGITPELAKAVVAYQTDPEIIMVEDTPAFTAYAEKIFDTQDKGAISALLAETLSGGSDGKPNMKEIQSLVKITAIRSQGLTLAEFDQQNKDKKRAVKKSFIDNAFDAVKSWTASWSKDKETTARVYKDLISEVEKNPPQSAEQASKVASSVVERAQAATNPNRTKYTIGQRLVNPAGVAGEVTGFKDNGEPIIKRVK